MVNVFIPYTPYHVFLSFLIASDLENDSNTLILGYSSKGNIDFLKSFKVFFPNVFRKIIITESTEGKGNLSRAFIKKNNMNLIKNAFNNMEAVDKIFYFCECHVLTQYAWYLAELNNPEFEAYFVEDGCATYCGGLMKAKSFSERFVDRIFYGKWHFDIVKSGSYVKTKGIFALFPALLPDRFDRLTKYSIRRGSAVTRLGSACFDDVFQDNVLDYAEFSSLKAIAVIDTEPFTETTEYRRAIYDLINECGMNGGKIGIKYHPADSRGDFLDVEKYDNVVLLPQFLPVEFFFVIFQEKIKKVIGGLTTGLMTARWLIPSAEAVSFCPKGLGRGKSDNVIRDVMELFRKIGIRQYEV